MRSPPKFLEGAYVSAVRFAMEEVREGRRTNNDARRIRGRKLFLMIPRMLLVKPRKGSLMPKSKLRDRFAQFARTLDRFDIRESGGFRGSCSCQIQKVAKFCRHH